MSPDLKARLYKDLEQKTTGELLEIWQANDRQKWSSADLEVIQEIILARLGELPQPPGLLVKPSAILLQNNLSAGSHNDLIPQQDGPTLYNPIEVRNLSNWIDRAAVFSVIAALVSNLTGISLLNRTLSDLPIPFLNNVLVKWFVIFLAYGISAGVGAALMYFPLKALSAVLRILMEMELSSRYVDL